MKQQTLTGFEKFGKTTRRALFLVDMDRHDLVVTHSSVGIDLGVECAPDETTVRKFRHLLVRSAQIKVLLKAANDHLHLSGIKISSGTIVNATTIGAPSSTKNQDGRRDPEMHQTTKGKQGYFGMRAHVGVDNGSELIHSPLASAAKLTDVHAPSYLLRGNGTRACGDYAFRGQTAIAACVGLRVGAERRDRRSKRPIVAAAVRAGAFGVVSRIECVAAHGSRPDSQRCLLCELDRYFVAAIPCFTRLLSAASVVAGTNTGTDHATWAASYSPVANSGENAKTSRRGCWYKAQ